MSSRCRIIWLRATGALDRHVTLVASGGPTDTPRIHIGAHSYGNRFTIIDAHESICIGKHCLIGPSCYISNANHSYATGKLIASQPMSKARVIIGDGALLGRA